ncbi:hypothetical protein [Marinobacter sp. OP 3.4]|uniref:hypothetical protein n=1 Tax=Marinobacter sp. OP 3.4 TaxID=3076501 RepID=UPI002E20B096
MKPLTTLTIREGFRRSVDILAAFVTSVKAIGQPLQEAGRHLYWSKTLIHQETGT